MPSLKVELFAIGKRVSYNEAKRQMGLKHSKHRTRVVKATKGEGGKRAKKLATKPKAA